MITSIVISVYVAVAGLIGWILLGVATYPGEDKPPEYLMKHAGAITFLWPFFVGVVLPILICIWGFRAIRDLLILAKEALPKRKRRSQRNPVKELQRRERKDFDRRLAASQAKAAVARTTKTKERV